MGDEKATRSTRVSFLEITKAVRLGSLAEAFNTHARTPNNSRSEDVKKQKRQKMLHVSLVSGVCQITRTIQGIGSARVLVRLYIHK